MLIPCIWPDGAADSYLHKLIEAKAEETIKLQDFGEAVATGNVEQVDAFARRVGIPAVFRRLPMRGDECKWKLDAVKFPRSQWAHLERDGVFGAMLDLTKGVVALKDFTEIVTLMGQSLAIGRQMAD